MTTEKIQEIAQLFIANPKLNPTGVMYGYIFGIYAENEHYSVEEIRAIKDTVVTLTTPVVTDEPMAPEGLGEEPQPTMEEIVQWLLPVAP